MKQNQNLLFVAKSVRPILGKTIMTAKVIDAVIVMETVRSVKCAVTSDCFHDRGFICAEC